jgi:hypothetical protein
MSFIFKELSRRAWRYQAHGKAISSMRIAAPGKSEQGPISLENQRVGKVLKNPSEHDIAHAQY